MPGKLGATRTISNPFRPDDILSLMLNLDVEAGYPLPKKGISRQLMSDSLKAKNVARLVLLPLIGANRRRLVIAGKQLFGRERLDDKSLGADFFRIYNVIQHAVTADDDDIGRVIKR